MNPATFQPRLDQITSCSRLSRYVGMLRMSISLKVHANDAIIGSSPRTLIKVARSWYHSLKRRAQKVLNGIYYLIKSGR